MITVYPASKPLTGVVVPEGDKSITHRAIFFGALNRASTRILAPARAADCRSTLGFIEGAGYSVREIDGGLEIDPDRQPAEPSRVSLLDCGNSGTTARLGLGFLVGEIGTFRLGGDSSLELRPMERVAAPLRDLGAEILTSGGRLPATVDARGMITGSRERVFDVASAQVHAALALAGLRSGQGVRVRRVASMRDHTLRLMDAFGLLNRSESSGDIDVFMPAVVDREIEITVPGDLSSAAFPVVAALLVPGSHIRIDGVGLNPTRLAFFEALRLMGADVTWRVDDENAWEPVGTIEARYGGALVGLDLSDGGVDAAVPVSAMIDELPLLALLGSAARGRTIVRGARELRVKESDRISATLRVLEGLGLDAVEHEDGFTIEGMQIIRGGAAVDHHGDHRLCMLAAVAALAAREPVMIPEPEVASVSWPGFWRELERLGAGAPQPGTRR